MPKVIQQQPTRTPIKRPLLPPPAMHPVFTKSIAPLVQTPSVTSPIQGSVSPPTQPNYSLPPAWLGAFRGR